VAVCVILGWPEGGAILYDNTWERPLPAEWLRQKMLTKREIAVEIARLVGELPTDETA